tara:strand:+ start:29560 stop:31839 length:2280 start_codon:yes stop_codon:yes gene_type:complete
MNQIKDNVFKLPTNNPERSGLKLDSDELSDFIMLINEHLNESERQEFPARMQEHVGKGASYALKDAVLEGLKVIYDKFKASDTGESEKKMLAIKLHERAEQCTPGFHNGVNAVVDGFYSAQDMNDLLYRVRQDIVARMATRLTDEVHTYNRCFVVAENAGYGVHALNKEDRYRGDLPDGIIQRFVAYVFGIELKLFAMLQGLEDQLKGQLGNVGYEGSKDSAYPVDEYHKIETILMQLFKDNPVVIELEAAQDALNQQDESKKVLTEHVTSSLKALGLTDRNIRVFLNPANMPLILKKQLEDTLAKLSDDKKALLESIKSTYSDDMVAFGDNARIRLSQANEAMKKAFFIVSEKGMTDIHWPNVRQVIWQGVKAHDYFDFTEKERAQLDIIMNPQTLDDKTVQWSAVISSLDDFMQAMRFLPPSQSTALFDAMKDDLKDFIKIDVDFMCVMKVLSPSQGEFVFDRIKYDLKDLIEELDGFQDMLDVLTLKQCNTLFDAMKHKLNDLIQTTGDLITVIRNLSPEKCGALFDAMKNKLNDLIQTTGDLIKVIRGHSPEKCGALLVGMKDNLNGIIKTATDFWEVMLFLSPEKCGVLLDTMKDDLKNIIKTVDDFSKVMQRLMPEQRTVLLDAMKDDLKDIIKTVDDFEAAVFHLSSENVAELIKHGESMLSRACADGVIDFAKFLIDQGVKPTEAMRLQAVNYGHLDMVQLLTEKLRPDVLTDLSSREPNPVSTAEFKGRLDAIKPPDHLGDKPSRGPEKG